MSRTPGFRSSNRSNLTQRFSGTPWYSHTVPPLLVVLFPPAPPKYSNDFAARLCDSLLEAGRVESLWSLSTLSGNESHRRYQAATMLTLTERQLSRLLVLSRDESNRLTAERLSDSNDDPSLIAAPWSDAGPELGSYAGIVAG